jgi:tetratricopeptide (TPR) repeat protein
VEVVEERGLRREAAKLEAVRPEAPSAAEVVERGLSRGPRASVVDTVPEGVLEVVEYLVGRFGVVLDKEAAFRARDFVVAKVQARLEKVAVKEPEFAHLLAEVAERVLSSFGRLMASPDAARHVYNMLFYFFEGYQTRDGEVLFKMIEHTVREAVKKAEEAGVPDAEYRVKQFVLELIDILAKAGERYRRDALRTVSTVEKALRATAFAGLSTAALYSVYSGLYSEAMVSSVASAVALAEVGQFREAVEYVQRAAKALYEAAKDVFEHVKITVQRLVELFVEAVARMLAWVDEHKAYLFLMAAGVVALSAALNLWGLVELDKLAYAASLTPFVPAGVKEYSREEVFKMLKEAPDPYEKYREVAKAANAGRVKLAEPWESLRMIIAPRSSEKERLRGKVYGELDERKKALFYATLALEEAFSDYRTALREVAEGLREAVKKVEVGEEPFKQDMYVADLGRLRRLAEKEEAAFEDALRALRRNLNEYAVRHDLGDLLNVEEGVAREPAEAKAPELSEFNDMNFGVKAYAALIAYREYALGRRSAFGIAAWYWLEVGGSAWLLYYTPITMYNKAEKAKAERPAVVEELVAEALRRLFLKPGADSYRGFVEELTKGGKLALMLEDKTKSSYVFRLFRLEEGGELKELEGIKLRISKVGDGVTYALEFDDIEKWRGFFGQELEAGVKAAEVVGERLPVEDRFPYMLGWVNSDVAISKGRLTMSTSHLWQLAETHALFDWSYIAVRGVNLTLEGPKPQFQARASLEKLDEAIRKSAEGGWLHMLGTKAGLEDLMYVKSWDELKQWVAGHWGIVVDATVKRLGEEVRSELETLRNKLNDDKIAREVVAPALLLIQAERLGVNETTLRYFGAVVSGAIGGDGSVSAAMKKVELISGRRAVALLWAAAFAAHGIRAKMWGAGSVFQVIVSGVGAARLAGLYFRYGSPLLEGDERIINHKLAEAMKLGAEGLSVSWEGLRRTKSGLVAADLTLSEAGVAVKYNIYLSKTDIMLLFNSTDRSRVELAARLLRLARVGVEVQKESSKDKWYVRAYTDMLAAGREELRKAIAKIVKEAVARGWIDAGKAERWLEKLERGLTLKEGWPKYHVVEGAPMVRYHSTSPDSIEREAQRLRDMGLEEGRHFSVKMPEGEKAGYVSILREGLERAVWLSVHGKDEQQRRLADEFVKYILQRAEEKGKDVYKKALEIVNEGKSWRSLRLEDFEGRVEVGGRVYVVKVRGGGAVEEDRVGRKLLRIKITAEVGRVEGEHTIVDRVVREYTITFGRHGRNNAAVGFAVARADAPGGREEDAERLAAVIKALTGKEPRIRRRSDGALMIVCGREHLDGFKRFAELADAIEKWLEETSR